MREQTETSGNQDSVEAGIFLGSRSPEQNDCSRLFVINGLFYRSGLAS